MGELISVIVPVYNGEDYLGRCVESLRRQTYPDLEIILIDDGSGDRTYEICEEYADVPGIRVYHQENCGLAETRNRGVRYAKGRYIGFCDADDFVHPEMYGRLYRCIRRADAEIAVCGYKRTQAESVEETIPGGRMRVYQSGAAFGLLVRGEPPVQSYAWNKLYARELFDDVKYPSGKSYEDQFTTWRLFLAASRIAVADWCGYYYFENPESITNRKWNPGELDYLEAWEEIAAFCRRSLPLYAPAASAQVVSASIYNLSRMRRAEIADAGTRRRLRKLIAENIRGYWKSDIRAATAKRKLFAYACWLGELFRKK